MYPKQLDQQTIQSLVSGEITLQLREHRRSIEQMIDAKIVNMKADMSKMVQEELNRHKLQVQKIINIVNASIDEVRSTSHVAPGNQLALSSQREKQMVLAITKRAEENVLAKIAPQMEKLGSWVQYQTQDTDVLLTDYRKAVCEDRDFLQLTGSTTDYRGAPRTSANAKGNFGPFTKFAFNDEII